LVQFKNQSKSIVLVEIALKGGHLWCSSCKWAFDVEQDYSQVAVKHLKNIWCGCQSLTTGFAVQIIPFSMPLFSNEGIL